MRTAGKIILCAAVVGVLFTGRNVQAAQEDGEYKIGVVVYDPDNPEMSMFMNYYRDYIEEGFPVRFYFSDVVTSAEEENAFILAAAQEGVGGIISFYGQDVQSTVEVCAENEIYYTLGSGTISDEDFTAVEDNPWFLGTVGPDPDSEYTAGVNMAEYFTNAGAASYLIMTGGAASGNFMHLSRVEGMLETLKEQTGLEFEGEAQAVAAAEKLTTLKNSDGTVSVTLCPGYTSSGAGLENLDAAFADGTYDTVMSAFYVTDFLDVIGTKEETQGSNIMVGTVDSFTEENFQVMQQKDDYGNPPIDFLEGKYASMAGPAFALTFNALTGNTEANTENGKAVRLYQGFWEATSKSEFIELYGYTTGIYENAYSCENLMQVIKAYNEAAAPEALKALTEAYTVEDVKARILGE